MSFTTIDIINIMRKRGRGDPPSALGDIFVNPLTRVLNYLSAKMDFSRAEQTVDGILVLLATPSLMNNLAAILNETVATLTARLKNALDEIASNFGMTRRPAVAARGSALFMRSTDPQTVLPINVVGGTRLSAPTIDQDYRVSNSFVITQMVFDTTYNRFVVSIPIESDSIGLSTNASAGEVSQLKDTVVGIDSVINPNAITGGRDEESDTELATRIKTALATNNIGTQTGYRNTVLQITNVQDATVIGAGNPLMVRDLGDGGSIDIYVTDPIIVSISELADASNTTNMGDGTWKFMSSRQPLVNDVNAIVPSANVVGISKDEDAYAGSIRAQDYILFDVDPTTLGYPVQFQINNLVTEVQDYIDDPARKILGADILVKEAVISLVDVVCQIAVLPNYTFNTVQAEVEAAVTQQIASLTIGAGLELSDIIAIMAAVPGVDRITIPFQKFNKSTSTGYVNIISAAANEVLRPGNITVAL